MTPKNMSSALSTLPITRGYLFEADIDLVPLQQAHAQVFLNYMPSPAALYLVSI